MSTALVIVESPAKAKTINKYLGKGYKVKSSVGHIRDLPSGGGATTDPKERAKQAAKVRKMEPKEKEAYKAAKAKATLIRRMGVNPEKEWEARYEVVKGKEKVLKELQDLAAKADRIYLATDLDREGEAIAWHLREVIGGDPDRYKRVTFSEITKKAIQEAFAQPSELNMDRVHAQQARRFLDRVVGFMVSPLLWKKVARGLSAGRVQSVAVRLVVEREREIRAFVPEEYWDLHADLEPGSGSQIRAEVVKHQGKAFKPTSEADINVALAALEPAPYKVAERKDRPSTSKPPSPFITSTLQQAASVRLGFSVKKTMTLAQRLYEAGLITYMRTDATALSAEAVNGCREFIEKLYGSEYLPEKPNIYSSQAGAQEAHEAIRPTDVRLEPEDVTERLERDQQRLYDLIWRQFVACQMPPAKFDTTSITIEAADYELRARGRVLRFAGWMKVLPPVRKKGDADVVLPDLAVGDDLKLLKLDPAQHFTKPPARFSEASLVRELEKRGIGRPSTYASIISTIQDRGYVRLDTKRLYAEKMGEIVTDRLNENFQVFMEYGFTASLEEQLDDVAKGDAAWRDVLDQFYQGFCDRLSKADEGMRGNEPVVVPEVACPECERPMAVRNAATGVFLSCTGYALSKKEGKCTKTLNLVPGEESVEVTEGEEEQAEVEELRAKRRCPLCGAAMDSWLIDEERRLHVCGNNPDCSGHELEKGTFRIKGYDGPIIECDKCGADMELRSGRFGKYFACTECKNTRKLLRNGEPAPPKIDPVPFPELACNKAPEDHYVLRDGAAGIFLAASSYPKVRDTRNPLVSELLVHKDELPEKYQFLTAAPAEDPDGNPTIVRFARKTKEHYVSSEKDGKPTKWAAYFADGKWSAKA